MVAFVQYAKKVTDLLDLCNSSDPDDQYSSSSSCSSTDDTACSVSDVALLLSPPFPKDSFRAQLLSDVSAILSDDLSALRPNNAALRRAVTSRLRSSGYDAGICSVKWAATGIKSIGNHEYVDVVVDSPSMWRRYIVELDFAAEFEIARPTPEYGRILETLPTVTVAKAEEMRPAVGAVTEAVAWSFMTQGMPVPPWRKRKYMLAKWLGAYSRTVDPDAAAAAGVGGGEVKCRIVGFHIAGAEDDGKTQIRGERGSLIRSGGVHPMIS